MSDASGGWIPMRPWARSYLPCIILMHGTPPYLLDMAWEEEADIHAVCWTLARATPRAEIRIEASSESRYGIQKGLDAIIDTHTDISIKLGVTDRQ